MGKHDNKFIMILDIDKVFSANELALVHDAGVTRKQRSRKIAISSQLKNLIQKLTADC